MKKCPTILTKQEVATFSVWDGELELWQPEGANDYKPRTEYTARYTWEPPTEHLCPWTDEMVQELWCSILYENLAEENRVWNDLEDLVMGEVVDINESS